MRPSMPSGRVCTAGIRRKRSVDGHFRPGGRGRNPKSPSSIAIRKAVSQADNTLPPYGAAIPDSGSLSRLSAGSSRLTAIAIRITAIESRPTTIRSRLRTRNSPDNRPRPGFLATCAPVFAAANRRQDTEITCVLSQGEARIFSVFILERGGERGDRFAEDCVLSQISLVANGPRAPPEPAATVGFPATLKAGGRLRLYCGTVLRHPAALSQAAKGSSPMFVLAIESCAALT